VNQAGGMYVRKIKTFVVFAMAALLALSATLPAGAASSTGYIVIRNEAPYYIYEFQVWFYYQAERPTWDLGIPCHYERRDGSYDELWFASDRLCSGYDGLQVWVRVWTSRSHYEDYVFDYISWGTRLTLTGDGWKRSYF